jgi:hypothetical protein
MIIAFARQGQEIAHVTEDTDGRSSHSPSARTTHLVIGDLTLLRFMMAAWILE